MEDPDPCIIVRSRAVAVLFVDNRPVDGIVFHRDLLGHDLLGADESKSFFSLPVEWSRSSGSIPSEARFHQKPGSRAVPLPTRNAGSAIAGSSRSPFYSRTFQRR